MPDGDSACDDIRWYCQDTRACAERWTQAWRQARAAGAAPPSSAVPALYPDSKASRSRFRRPAAVPQAPVAVMNQIRTVLTWASEPSASSALVR
jgi:hypothetical protein